ncbi:AfsR/SARP family transcriptional regulator [Streptomyces albireticuli]|uniref:AfsR family transcriptional regulator n=1 Tax=Streptomyces albireticuli TaxID=1940 RepID=A0A2A2D9F9_9ACTN|nr:BTAD domain-containing putative transcriptional regulator [Streptomyces albireticuli]MCD9140853.1 winged helix-turn-helix domain-containing protein [Streptomyces albireticuli]MCD9161185.1 winged helix-turn-helix domain-containing protein [Streptomyces albireticuli]MCD9190757.1 winged helix-turn-helix domain-containing protein [Streptomyces albireticuli]PAU48155.1 AfsR family transcriptional regulator [Streptomyces albireticuli]
MRTEASILGPLVLTVDAVDVTPSAGRQRSLLAALLLEPDRIVPPEVLVEDMWGAAPPANAGAQLQNYVHLLRKRIERAGGPGSGMATLERHPVGYVLHVTTTDHERFVELLGTAREELHSGAYERCQDAVGQAMLLYRGPAFAGVPRHSRRMTDRLRDIEADRCAALALRIDARLRLGRHTEVVPELRALVQEYPAHEGFRTQLSFALYHAGRTAEALEASAELPPGARAALRSSFRGSGRELVGPVRQGAGSSTADVARLPARRRPPAGDRLRFSVLGPVRAWRGEEPLHTGSPQQRGLLAALLLRGHRTATAAELLEDLWGDEPPHAALAALRTYASRLRKAFGPDGDILVSESGGYALHLQDAWFDLDAMEGLVADSGRARGAGDPVQALARLDEALALWDGEPLAGLPGPFAETQRSRLEEWRLQLTESRVELRMELGRHAEVVSELTALTAQHPLRERLRELLMLALYRSGRQAEALAVYADTRRLLADELGVDPGPALSELQQRILHADTRLDHDPPTEEAAAEHVPGPVPVRPAQLPADVPDFTGRGDLVGELTRTLVADEHRATAVSVLTGIGGVGKTTLALHVAHAVGDRFPDGLLYVDLRGAGPDPVDPATVLGDFLPDLGVPAARVPAGVAARSALYRSLLDRRRTLVVLDDARDAGQVRPLLPGAPGSAAIVTSRARLSGISGARQIDVPVMDRGEALLLFTRIVGEERVTAEPEGSLEVVEACGRLPLAVRIAGSRLVARPSWSVGTLAAKLANERRRLDELRAGDLVMRSTFELGYGRLTPPLARAFRLLGTASGPDFSLPAAAALLGSGADDDSLDEVEELLESLVDSSLLESPAPLRYRFHDLVRLYARACARRDEPPEERRAATTRLLGFQLCSATVAQLTLRPRDRGSRHLARGTGFGLSFDDRGEALEWLFAEAGSVLATVEDVMAEPPEVSDEDLRRAVDTLWAMGDVLEDGESADRFADAAGSVAAVAEERGARLVEARARYLLVKGHEIAGRIEEAEAEVRRAEIAAVTVRDPLSLGHVLRLKGSLSRRGHEREQAAKYLGFALDEFRGDGNDTGEAVTLASLSRLRLDGGGVDRALEDARHSVRILREPGGTPELGTGLNALGLALERAGDLRRAVEALDEARALFHEWHQRRREGLALFRIARIRLSQGAPSVAADLAEQALGALAGVGSDRRRAKVLLLLGRALDGLGETDRARSAWQEALSRYGPEDSPEADTVRILLETQAARRMFADPATPGRTRSAGPACTARRPAP